jgi:hypothetical protein
VTGLLGLLACTVVVVGLLAAVVLARRFEAAAVDAVVRSTPRVRLGALRVAIVTRAVGGVEVDALLDEVCMLGAAGAPLTLVLRGERVSDDTLRLLERWAATDAVVEMTIPAAHPSAARVIDLRSADAALSVPLDDLRS